MNEKQTTVNAPAFEWTEFRCEVCGFKTPIWQAKDPAARPSSWRRRRFCSSCLVKLFPMRTR